MAWLFGFCDVEFLTAAHVTQASPRMLVGDCKPPATVWTLDPTVSIGGNWYWLVVVVKERFNLRNDSGAVAGFALIESLHNT